MMLRQLLGCAVVLACVSLAAAEDKKDAPGGVWVQKGGELKIDLTEKNVLKIAPHGDENVIALVFKYTVSDGGAIKVKLTELAGKEEIKEKAKDKFPIGLEFSFKMKVKGASATIEDVEGENVDVLKSRLEGEYEKK